MAAATFEGSFCGVRLDLPVAQQCSGGASAHIGPGFTASGLMCCHERVPGTDFRTAAHDFR